MLKYLLALTITVLTGCTSAPNLPPTDTIINVKPTESGITANSNKYSYRFFRNGVPQEYQRYNAFYQRFNQVASGVRVNFVVKQHEVVAQYLVVIDKRRLDAAQQTLLTEQYQATALDSDHLGVLFKASGFWTNVEPGDLDESHRLATPIVVSINDKTQAMTTLGAIALVPIFPLVMMYGCATGPCV